jgi:hypothetical protein
LEAISKWLTWYFVWSGGILTLAYIKLPAALGIPEQKLDPTFIASVFTGVLATFGVQTAKKSGDGTMKMGGAGGNSALRETDCCKAQTAPAQTIRIEQGTDSDCFRCSQERRRTTYYANGMMYGQKKPGSEEPQPIVIKPQRSHLSGQCSLWGPFLVLHILVFLDTY